MTKPIVECIPNYSEARRVEVIKAIEEAVLSIENVYILDRHSDFDHNRTVLTIIGDPASVEEAAFKSIAKAAELINLDEHTGKHPRIGATDVVPFVPISGLTMQDCVQIAQRLGRRVGDELGIPVYFYEEAATRPERKNLENIRRGEYETLKTEITSNPDRKPDYGPSQLGSAGATVIGAREPLIAFNVYLTTDDQSIAEKIARTIRHSSGGLRYVKALGMIVEGRSQVSMNLTNYKKTSLATVVETIRREAARYGVAVHHSELVGMIPQEAVVDTAVWYTQLDEFVPEQILESHLYAALERTEDAPTKAQGEHLTFLDSLSASTPTPGGGSAAAFSGASAAALVAMVARLTIGRKKYAAVENEMQAALEQAESLRQLLTQAVVEDAAAYDKVMDAYRMPKDTQQEQAVRQDAIQEAIFGAAQVPLTIAKLAVKTLELAYKVVASGNINAMCDGGTAAALALASLSGASLNVRINVKDLHDESHASMLEEEIAHLESQALSVEAQIREVLQERGGLSFL
jgi:glutamate formiminotransferase / formiminotetrahydrofolate cyclodeaminase